MRVSMAGVVLAAAMLGGVAVAGEGKIKVLVVTGGHGFNHDAFFAIFKGNPEIDYNRGIGTV